MGITVVASDDLLDRISPKGNQTKWEISGATILFIAAQSVCEDE